MAGLDPAIHHAARLRAPTKARQAARNRPGFDI
jgi:hypothetical protein